MGSAPSRSIAVLGGGITGLTAAHRLAADGHRVRLFEGSPRLGGAIRSETFDGWLVEHGPNSLLASAVEVHALLRELQLEAEIERVQPGARNRYIVRQGRPVPAPMSPGTALSTPLLSAGAKLRVLLETTRRRCSREHDVSVAEFIRGHFGDEVLDYLAQPFVSGIHAGDPTQLSAQHAFPALWAMEREHGSLLRGQAALARARRVSGQPAGGILSFRQGLATLVRALASRLPDGCVVLNARVESLARDADRWLVRSAGPAGPAEERFDAVVAAVPAGALAALTVEPGGRQPLAALAAIEHPPLASLFLGYRREQVRHPLDGFGLLVPAREARSILGVLFSSSLFAGRAPAGHVALTVLVGGALQPALAALPPPELIARVRRDLSDLLGVTGEPVLLRHAFWPRAIPQYTLGYERYREAMAACEREHAGLFIGGSVRDGISLPDCIRSGLRLAARAGG